MLNMDGNKPAAAFGFFDVLGEIDDGGPVIIDELLFGKLDGPIDDGRGDDGGGEEPW